MEIEFYKSECRTHILPAITLTRFFSETTLKFSFLVWELDITWRTRV